MHYNKGTMTKNPKSFRLSDAALSNLDQITKASGCNDTAAIEMSLAAMARGLFTGDITPYKEDEHVVLNSLHYYVKNQIPDFQTPKTEIPLKEVHYVRPRGWIRRVYQHPTGTYTYEIYLPETRETIRVNHNDIRSSVPAPNGYLR
jgi:hypothetical protein